MKATKVRGVIGLKRAFAIALISCALVGGAGIAMPDVPSAMANAACQNYGKEDTRYVRNWQNASQSGGNQQQAGAQALNHNNAYPADC
jgi:hypothetical protein